MEPWLRRIIVSNFTILKRDNSKEFSMSPIESAKGPQDTDASMSPITDPIVKKKKIAEEFDQPLEEVNVKALTDEDATLEEEARQREVFFQKIMQSYKEKNKAVDEYKSGFSEPKMVNGTIKLNFPDSKSAADFFKDFSASNPDQAFLLMNPQGEVVARIENGKMQVFDGENGFKDADENTVLPAKGMGLSDFSKLSSQSFEAKKEAPTTSSENTNLRIDKIELGKPGEKPVISPIEEGGIKETVDKNGNIERSVNPAPGTAKLGAAVDAYYAKNPPMQAPTNSKADTPLVNVSMAKPTSPTSKPGDASKPTVPEDRGPAPS